MKLSKKKELKRLERERKALQQQLKDLSNFRPLPIVNPQQIYSLKRTTALIILPQQQQKSPTLSLG